MTVTQVDVTSATFKANPFPFYAQLRVEAPVFPVTVPMPTKQRAWLITRYNDVLEVLKDARFAKNPRNAMSPEQLKKMPWMPPMVKPLEQNMLDLDSPDHTRLRALVHKAFTPRLIEQMRDQIQVLTNELLDAAEPKGGMDLIADFALPLPLTIIGRILGVPAEDIAFGGDKHELLCDHSYHHALYGVLEETHQGAAYTPQRRPGHGTGPGRRWQRSTEWR